MKKISILSATLLAAMTLSAQETVVKDAEKAMKSGKSFAEVVSIITPATENPETSQKAITYYIPGKAAFKNYDDMLGKRQLGMFKQEDPKTPEIFHTMAKDLVGGYDYYIKALSLDTVIDAKGKTKTKYSKEIVNTLVGHHTDFNTAALDFWNVKDYENAYRSWDIYLTMPGNPALAKDIKVAPDTIIAEIMYNQALAAWQANQFDKATKAFINAFNKGYDKEQLFQYGAAVAENAKDMDSYLFFVNKGGELYPENTNFINLLINYYLKSDKLDEAITSIDNAIASNPQNAQYHALKGIIYDNKKMPEEAMKCYTKALELNPENAIANFYYGVGLAAKADNLSDAYNGTNFESYKEKEISPLRRQAAQYLEKAYNLDKSLHSEALKILAIIYYNIDDAQGMESVKQRQLDD